MDFSKVIINGDDEDNIAKDSEELKLPQTKELIKNFPQMLEIDQFNVLKKIALHYMKHEFTNNKTDNLFLDFLSCLLEFEIPEIFKAQIFSIYGSITALKNSNITSKIVQNFCDLIISNMEPEENIAYMYAWKALSYIAAFSEELCQKLFSCIELNSDFFIEIISGLSQINVKPFIMSCCCTFSYYFKNITEEQANHLIRILEYTFQNFQKNNSVLRKSLLTFLNLLQNTNNWPLIERSSLAIMIEQFLNEEYNYKIIATAVEVTSILYQSEIGIEAINPISLILLLNQCEALQKLITNAIIQYIIKMPEKIDILMESGIERFLNENLNETSSIKSFYCTVSLLKAILEIENSILLISGKVSIENIKFIINKIDCEDEEKCLFMLFILLKFCPIMNDELRELLFEKLDDETFQTDVYDLENNEIIEIYEYILTLKPS